MTEFLKLLIEKPENLRRHVINFLKIILSLIIATRIYSYLFGEFEPILIGDKNFWRDIYEFILSGKVLIVITVFLFSRLVILEFISMFTFYLVHLIPKLFSSKKGSVLEKDGFRLLFKVLGILKIEKGNHKIPEPGRNFHIALEVARSNAKSDLHEAVFEIKRTNIFESFNLYIGFTLVYFLLLTPLNHPTITIILIIGIIVLFLFLLAVEQLFKIIEYDYDYFEILIRWIHQIHLTEDYIKKNGLLAHGESELSKVLPYTGEITYNNTSYFIIHNIEGQNIGKLLRRMRRENPKGKGLVITDTKLPKALRIYLKEESFEVIRFDDEDHLTKKLDKVFFSSKIVSKRLSKKDTK
ncbi:hypothetical protein [Seonamhaeicola sp.]|uniref:hypothetical protein n=1 Tax=Seonamhaeicola sp. TaxID=1912245 RepID=UPI0026329932|nr:hypothetical protein [Seonamhaeicola sp.]